MRFTLTECLGRVKCYPCTFLLLTTFGHKLSGGAVERTAAGFAGELGFQRLEEAGGREDMGEDGEGHYPIVVASFGGGFGAIGVDDEVAQFGEDVRAGDFEFLLADQGGEFADDLALGRGVGLEAGDEDGLAGALLFSHPEVGSMASEKLDDSMQIVHLGGHEAAAVEFAHEADALGHDVEVFLAVVGHEGGDDGGFVGFLVVIDVGGAAHQGGVAIAFPARAARLLAGHEVVGPDVAAAFLGHFPKAHPRFVAGGLDEGGGFGPFGHFEDAVFGIDAEGDAVAEDFQAFLVETTRTTLQETTDIVGWVFLLELSWVAAAGGGVDDLPAPLDLVGGDMVAFDEGDLAVVAAFGIEVVEDRLLLAVGELGAAVVEFKPRGEDANVAVALAARLEFGQVHGVLPSVVEDALRAVGRGLDDHAGGGEVRHRVHHRLHHILAGGFSFRAVVRGLGGEQEMDVAAHTGAGIVGGFFVNFAAVAECPLAQRGFVAPMLEFVVLHIAVPGFHELGGGAKIVTQHGSVAHVVAQVGVGQRERDGGGAFAPGLEDDDPAGLLVVAAPAVNAEDAGLKAVGRGADEFARAVEDRAEDLEPELRVVADFVGGLFLWGHALLSNVSAGSMQATTRLCRSRRPRQRKRSCR